MPGDTDPMLSQLFLEFGKFSTKMDDMSSKQSEMSTAVAVVMERIADLPDHEKRIRALEKDEVNLEEFAHIKRQIAALSAWRYKWAGATGALSLVLGAVGVLVGHKVF